MAAPPIGTVRHPHLSVWQGLVARRIRGELAGGGEVPSSEAVREHPMMRAATAHAQATVDGRALEVGTEPSGEDAGLLAYLHQVHHRIADLRRNGETLAAAELEEAEYRKYGTYDTWNWIKYCGEAYLKWYIEERRSAVYRDWKDPRYGNGNPNYSVVNVRIPADGRVAIIGDWGTGMDDARTLLTQILRDHDPSVLIHLGDIYYAGLADECRLHVVELIRQAFQEVWGNRGIPVYCIPGNHEYYSGGQGFYNTIDSLNLVPGMYWQQAASYFCLRSEDGAWQILGGDTGQSDYWPEEEGHPIEGAKLRPSEIEWHLDKLQSFAGRTIFLTHHQLFSARQKVGSDFRDKPYLNQNLLDPFRKHFQFHSLSGIAAWFWGHEHSYGLFQDGLFGLLKGRLLGCSGYEAAQSEDPYKIVYPEVAYHRDMVQLGQVNEYYNHAFAILDFGRRGSVGSITASYYQIPSWGGSVPVDRPANQPYKLYEELIGVPPPASEL